MKNFMIAVLTLFLFAFGGFVEGFEDLPMAPNWQQKGEDVFSFGNVDAKFVQIELESKNESFDNLVSFYKNTLPQLGWKFNGTKNGDFIFVREKEVLIIENVNKIARITIKGSN